MYKIGSGQTPDWDSVWSNYWQERNANLDKAAQAGNSLDNAKASARTPQILPASRNNAPSVDKTGALLDARAFDPNFRVYAWGQLYRELNNPTFPLNLFDPMCRFLQLQGQKRDEDRQKNGMPPPLRDTRSFALLASPRKGGNGELLIDALIEGFWLQAAQEDPEFLPKKLSQFAYTIPLWFDSEHAPAMLAALLGLATDPRMHPDGCCIGNLGLNLRYVPKQHEQAVLGLYAFMAERASNAVFTSQEIGNAVYGMHNLVDSDETKRFLRALTAFLDKAISSGFLRFKEEEIGSALCGLQHMSSQEAQDFVIAVTRHMAKARAAGKPITFTGHGIGVPLFGLQRISGTPAAQAFLAELNEHLKKIPPGSCRFSGQNIGNIGHGLQHMPDCPAAHDFLRWLSKQMNAQLQAGHTIRFNSHGVSTALCWLPNLSDSDATQDFLDALGKHLQATPMTWWQRENITHSLFLSEVIGNLGRHLQAKASASILSTLYAQMGQDIHHDNTSAVLHALQRYRNGQADPFADVTQQDADAESWRLFATEGRAVPDAPVNPKFPADLEGIQVDSCIEIDLHGCTPKHRQRIAAYALGPQCTDVAGAVFLIYGKGLSIEYNHGVARAAMQQLLQNTAALQDLKLGKEFHPGQVWLHKPHPTSAPLSNSAETIDIDMDSLLYGDFFPHNDRLILMSGGSCRDAVEQDGGTVEPLKPQNRAGVYPAKITLNTSNGPVTGQATMFPDAWDAGRIAQAIREAWDDARKRGTQDEDEGVLEWQGRCSAGFEITFQTDVDETVIYKVQPLFELQQY